MDFITQLDHSIFFFINHLPHTPELNQLFLLFSYNPVVVWGVLALILIFFQKGKNFHFLIDLFGALFLAAIITSVIIKPLIGRPRPDLSHGESVIIVTEAPAAVAFNNDYAFPSGHAAVAFAGAYVMSRKFAKGKKWFYAVAILTALSRIYLGKHYFSDVFVGGMIGVGIGYLLTKYFGFSKS